MPKKNPRRARRRASKRGSVFSNRYALCAFRRLFCRIKTPGGRAAGIAKGVGAIQSPSVAQWSGTRLGSKMLQNFDRFLKFFRTIWDVPKIDPIFVLLTFFQQFPKTQFAQKITISMIWSSRSVLPSQNCDAHLFHVQKKHGFS